MCRWYVGPHLGAKLTTSCLLVELDQMWGDGRAAWTLWPLPTNVHKVFKSLFCNVFLCALGEIEDQKLKCIKAVVGDGLSESWSEGHKLLSWSRTSGWCRMPGGLGWSRGLSMLQTSKRRPECLWRVQWSQSRSWTMWEWGESFVCTAFLLIYCDCVTSGEEDSSWTGRSESRGSNVNQIRVTKYNISKQWNLKWMSPAFPWTEHFSLLFRKQVVSLSSFCWIASWEIVSGQWL